MRLRIENDSHCPSIARHVYDIALVGGVLLLPLTLVTTAVGLLLASLTSPFLPGGLSSQIAAIVGTDERELRRAQDTVRSPATFPPPRAPPSSS